MLNEPRAFSFVRRGDVALMLSIYFKRCAAERVDLAPDDDDEFYYKIFTGDTTAIVVLPTVKYVAHMWVTRRENICISFTRRRHPTMLYLPVMF